MVAYVSVEWRLRKKRSRFKHKIVLFNKIEKRIKED